MVKSIFLIIVLATQLISVNVLSQNKEKDIWWLRSPENKKFEDNFEFIFSELDNGILQQQLNAFSQLYLELKAENEVKPAMFVKVTSLKEEQLISITYITDYYAAFVKDINVQKVSKFKDQIVFFEIPEIAYLKVNKQLLFGLLRVKFKDKVKILNDQYLDYNKGEEGTPVILPVLEHQIPIWEIRIKDGQLLDKTMKFE